MCSWLREENWESVSNTLSNPVLNLLWPFLFLHLAETSSNVASLKFAAEEIVVSLLLNNQKPSVLFLFNFIKLFVCLLFV